MAERVGPDTAEAPPPIQALAAKKKRQGARWAPCLTSVRGHRWGSTKVKTDRVLLDVEAGGSDELPLLVGQSFKHGRYSPLTGMEEEWQIMLEQFIAMGVVVKDEVLNIDSEW
jgi:hypothetical protein